MSVDVLAFGPHPDDAEIGVGATLLKLKANGHSTGIIDLTAGDLGWGTPEVRAKESAAASKLLKLDVRENLDMGDFRVTDSFENQCKVAAAIRKHRPQVVLAPYYDLPITRGLGHNDHWKGGQVVANAFNLAHLRKAPVAGEAHQAKAIYFYYVPPGTRATFIVDVSDQVEAWLDAIDCHQSQFHNPEKPSREGAPPVREYMRANARHWGWQIGASYGQAFIANTPLRVRDPMALVKDVVPRPY
jgi:bacillithiol biosynthesis deacetylase BshB1